jgi:hypothetical protein
MQFSIFSLPVWPCEDWNLQQREFAWCFIWGSNSVPRTKVMTSAEGERNIVLKTILNQTGGRNRMFEKNDVRYRHVYE